MYFYFDQIKNLVATNVDNCLFLKITDKEINEIKELLKVDNGFYDIIIDFSDLEKLNFIINQDDEKIKSIILEQYLYYKILKESKCSLDYIDLEKIENILFSENIKGFEEFDFIFFMDIENELDKIAKKQFKNKKVRLHFLLDTFEDVNLQIKINDLIFSRSPIVMMGYSKFDDLKSYITSVGQFIQDPYDYNTYKKNKYVKNLKKY